MSIPQNTSVQDTDVDLRARVEDLNQMILDGKILEAHDKHYAESVVQQENEDEPTVGKAANRAREEAWLDNVTAFRAAEVKSVAVDPQNRVTMVEWFFDYSHAEWGVRRYHQVARQQWKDGKIVHERFYYGN
jgi:hypothetical protein